MESSYPGRSQSEMEYDVSGTAAEHFSYTPKLSIKRATPTAAGTADTVQLRSIRRTRADLGAVPSVHTVVTRAMRRTGSDQTPSFIHVLPMHKARTPPWQSRQSQSGMMQSFQLL